MSAHDRHVAVAALWPGSAPSTASTRPWAGCSPWRSACTAQSRSVVFVSLLPIAAGHALSIALVARPAGRCRPVLAAAARAIGAGLLLLGWAAYHWRFGHRHRVRVGMQTGLWGLAVWSFLMATAHGAGLMLWPALMPSACRQPCSTAGPPPRPWASASTRWRCSPSRRSLRPGLRVARPRDAAARLAQRRPDLDGGAGGDGCAAACRSNRAAQLATAAAMAYDGAGS